ncbi:MAG: Rid family hydrolase, partial [Blastocatellia bacterium]
MKKVRLLSIGILIGLSFAAAASYGTSYGKGPSRRYINLPNRNVQAPFSDGVLVGNSLYLAGRLGLDPKTNQIPSDIEQEARLMLDGFKDVLGQAGMTMDDLVTVTLYCPDLTLFEKFNGVYRSYYKKDFPARAFIGSGT